MFLERCKISALLLCCLLLAQCSNKAILDKAPPPEYEAVYERDGGWVQSSPSVQGGSSPINSSPASEGSVNHVIDKASTYLGTPYLFGGNDYSGIDCSGLVKNSFADVMPLPRISYQQAEVGTSVRLSNVELGDVVFFVTAGSRRINHAGIVTKVGGVIEFIHSSSSKGVIISNLDNPYWSSRFREARRYLD